jgi:hypothetical protein
LTRQWSFPPILKEMPDLLARREHMKRFIGISILLLLVLLACSLYFSAAIPAAEQQAWGDLNHSTNGASQTTRANGQGKIDQDFGRMPLYFIPNHGQVDSRVAYYIQGRDKSIYFTSAGLTYVLSEAKAGEAIAGELRSRKDQSRYALKLDFLGANANVRPAGEEKTGAVISYFKGKPEEWKTGLPTYSRIVYKNLWQGIDLAYYGTVDKMKYEFIVHPGSDPSLIRLAYRGVSGVGVNDEGRLEVRTPAGGFEDDRPLGYQEIDGARVDVALEYLLEEQAESEPGSSKEEDATKSYVYGFNVGSYDRAKPLVLDPAVLVYCGYIGGSEQDYGNGIAVDGSGNAYVTGETGSTAATFPVSAGPDLTHNGDSDAFVAKVNAAGTALVYCGYIGGSNNDIGWDIAVDGSGNVYVTGETRSSEATFPVSVGPDLTYNGYYEAFVAKVNASGTALVYCGYIGGSGLDQAFGIAVDLSGNAYVTGYTESSEATFPVSVGPDLTNNGNDAFVAKVNASGTGLVYCGYIGGSLNDSAWGIAVDGSGNAYVTGYAQSTEATFPVSVGPDLTHNGGYDAFVAKVNALGTGFVYCGYIGGSDYEIGYGVAVDGSGNAYVTGDTVSTEATFPVIGGPDLTHNGGYDAFVAKVNASGTGLVYCGYIGGSDTDWQVRGIAVDGSGSAYVTGGTSSTAATFPVSVGPDLTYNGNHDAFVAKVNTSGTGLVYCGYIGGSNGDRGQDIAVDSAGKAYVIGSTSSTAGPYPGNGFPVIVGPDVTHNGNNDTFVAKISYNDPSATITVSSPNGGESWSVGSGQSITWTSNGVSGNVDIMYSTNGGSNWTSVAADTANDGLYSWTVPNTPSTICYVQVLEHDASAHDSSDAAFTITTSTVETVSTPTMPSGSASGTTGTSYAYSTGGSTSSLGHDVEYYFDWDDGTSSGWRAVGITSAAKIWSAPGTYHVRTKARCAAHTAIESLWSATYPVIIYDGGGSTGNYNSPAQYKVLPEVIWASATGGGTWMSNVQVNDVSGGSIVSVYYNTGTTRRGPFQLWDNSGGGALSSAKYDNLLETIDQLDAETFAYYGTVGSVEFITQDGNHKVQAAARTLNGYYAKTFTAVSLHDANTANTSRAMVVANLTNDVNYRSTSGFFNPTGDSVTVEFTLLDANNSQVGTQFNRTLAGHEFQAFNPFNQAGVSYPTYSYDNVILRIRPTSGTGKVMCFGATVDNATNDPAAHVAVQWGGGHDNSPGSQQILPEAIWASATGGGTWVSEVQIIDATGGSVVSVYFDYGGGSRRGPFTLWTGSAASSKVKYINLLEAIDNLDTEVFAYYGKVGAVEFQTQDVSHYIQVTARTLNGNYSKTFPGLNLVNAETADTTRVMLIQNYTNNSGYRSTSGFYNPTADSVTVEFTLLDGNGAQIGTQFNKTLAGHDFQAFNPFIQAGVPYPGSSYDNVILRIRPTSGTGEVMCFGASVDNTSNDPASHLAVQGQ